ncbi:O-antigen ligase family protein [Geodermatophilus sp. YIM 151500]|uniref:O-antigen ligase family protein n=1 Tax=Geodermatophilus sp. YIM 151500 TaxID=2984531 RepID=UPI0021E4325F|nr:O-antigen ligase family protein [Geodermatophilus sp. YIM 151500]MCV2491135.1 O-antigen ligase family protein [Geodermatophilus sp. YIM 151500]
MVRAYAPMWILGLGFLWWPVVLLRGLGRYGQRKPPSPLPTLVVICLVLSLLVAAVAGAPAERLAGAAYNLAVWVALAALTSVRLDPAAIGRGIAQLAGVQSIAVLVALVLHPALRDVPLPASHVLPAALLGNPALESFTTARLTFPDWFGETVLRTGGFFGNATWAGGLSALGVLVTLPLVARAHGMARVGWVVVLTTDAATLYLSYSRNTWLALAAALGAMGVVFLRRRRHWSALTLGALVGVGAAIAAALTVDLAATMATFNSVREGSYGSRAAIYTATWQAVQEGAFPLLGSGVKERAPGLAASLGTHSGYLGLLYRGGWAAVVLFVVWLLALCHRAWCAASPVALGATVFAALWFVAEDVDVGHLVPLALVLGIALVDDQRAAEGARSPVEVPTSTATWR